MPLTAIAMPEEQQQPAQPAPQPQAQTVPDPAHVILSAAQTDDKSRADAWEIYHNHEGKEFEDKLAATSLPQDAKSALWQAKTREATTKAQRAQQASQAPKQDVVEDYLDQTANNNNPVVGAVKGAYQGAKGLYHGLMGDAESTHGQTTTESPATPNLGFTPEHIGQTAGEFGRDMYQFGKGLVQNVTGIGSETGKRLPLLVPDQAPQSESQKIKQSVQPPTEKSIVKSITDPHAQTLIGKYVMAPSMGEREASEQELEKYYQTHGAAAFGHALSAFIHGTLGEYVPLIGPLAGDIMDTGAKGDIGGALTKVAGLYATEKAGEAGKDAIKKRVAPYVAKVTEGMKTPAVKQAEANVEVTAKNREAAQKAHDAVKAQHDAHIASHEQGVDSPSSITSKLEKTQAALDEATFHDDAAKARLEKVQKENSLPRRAGQAIAKVLPKAEAPAAPEAPITAAVPELKPLEPKAALPQLGEPRTPPTVSPAHATTTIPQEPTGRPQGPSGPVQLPGGEPVGKMKLLGEGTPIGPQVPEGGLPKIKAPETPAPKTPKPERGRLGELKVDEKGNVVEKDPQGAHLQHLLEESLKNTKGNESFPAATVEPTTKEVEDRRKDTTPVPAAQEQREAPRRGETSERRQEEVPVENERRQGERRVLKEINERTFQESAFGNGEENKGIDTDAYAAATEQARKELGPDATKEAVIARRNEIVGDTAKGPKGDIGAQARQANPEPTRAETKKPVLPNEEPTGYAPKKEELVPAGEEGREPVKSAAEYHPAVEQTVSELSDENLKKLAKAHGLNPDEYDFKARDERRHRTERDQLAKDITAQMDDEEKINIGRAAEAAEKEPGFASRDQSAQARAARAEKLFPRLREDEGPAGSYGSKNKGVTKQSYEDAKKAFRDKATRSNAGLDPTMLADAAKVAAYHFEAGAREFADWSKAMVESLGEGIRPQLQKLWEEANKKPETAENPEFVHNSIADWHNEHKGFSYNPKEGFIRDQPVFSVAGEFKGDDYEKVVKGEKITDADVKEFMERPKVKEALEANPDLNVGGWNYKGDAHLELSKMFKDKDEAIAEGKRLDQDSIYDHANRKNIDTGGKAAEELKAKTEAAEKRKADFPDKIKRPAISSAVRTGKELLKKYGEVTGDSAKDPKFVTFILDNGQAVGNTGVDHDVMLGGKATDANPRREQFVNSGNIRVRAHQGTAGRETTFSIPESGVNAKQLKAIEDMAPRLGSGAVMIEVGKPGGKYAVVPYGEATPERLQQAINETLGNATGKGEAPKSVGGAAAGAALSKEPPTNLGTVPGTDISVASKMNPKELGTLKSNVSRENAVENMAKLPEVQELVDAATQGAGERKWYQRSGQAFTALSEAAQDNPAVAKYFKPDMRDKFVNFVAALSPQQPVKMDLQEALHSWTKAVDMLNDGKSDKEISTMLHQELTMSSGKVNSAMKALKGEPIWDDLRTKAFKVPSFGDNLNGFLDRVTNDGWMALFNGIKNAGDLSKASLYHPISVLTRVAAEHLGWEPAEAQAAIWAVIKTLTEKGTVDQADIRTYSADIADLMQNDPDIKQQLTEMGFDTNELNKQLTKHVEAKPEVPAELALLVKTVFGNLLSVSKDYAQKHSQKPNSKASTSTSTTTPKKAKEENPLKTLGQQSSTPLKSLT